MANPRWLRFQWIAILAALATLVAACGEGGNAAPGEEPTNGNDSTTGAEPEEAQQAADAELDPDATLTWSYSAAAGLIDPDRAPAFITLAYLRPAYDTLLTRSETGEIEPRLATSYAFVDDTTFELELEEGVVFHDGSTFDAETVKTNLERTMTVEGGTQQELLASVESIEVIDASTVRIHLNEPDSTLPGVLTTFPGVMISKEAIGDGIDLNSNAVGTGAYELESFDAAVEVSYTRFKDAWRPEDAGAARLVIINNADSAVRLNQLKTDQTDTTHLDPQHAEEAESEGLQVLSSPADNLWHLSYNIAREPLASATAREAIDLAIDRQALVDALDFGYGAPAAQIQPEGQAGHNSDITPKFDPERARELASQSGLQDVTLRFLSTTSPTLRSYQEAVSAMLADVGIEVEIVGVEDAQRSAEFRGGNWDMLVYFWPGAADPWLSYNSLLSDSLFNPSGELPEDVAEALTAVRTEMDPDVRVEKLEQLAAVVDEQAMLTVLSHPQRPTAARPEVVNFHGNVHAVPELRGTGIAAE